MTQALAVYLSGMTFCGVLTLPVIAAAAFVWYELNREEGEREE